MVDQVSRPGRQPGGIGFGQEFVKICYLVESDGV